MRVDLGGWLRSLGLERYETAFRENEIDDTVLLKLTAGDLKDLGVAVVGHRRRLLDAIALLRGDANAKAPHSEDPSILPRPAQDTAERRQVTVMFSDLVGSTALSARMDPEDLREVISAYQKCVAETVQRFGGFVAKYMGDGVLVYFGYPQAHEDDAERAVRAGLELVGAVSALKAPAPPLQTRIGIATGLVVVGDLIGTGSAQEQAVVGETPNLAARLQGIAEPNTLVIAESTRKLIGNLFELQDLGAREVKGIVEPVRTWAALRASSVASRFEALHATGLTALVGREEELELLLRRWSRAKTSEGQVVLLSGEAGIGKSRLTASLMERLASEPHTRLRYFCSPQHTDSALYPVISQMERAAGFVHDDTPQAKLGKLDAVLAQTSASTQEATLFAEMLSLPKDGRYPALELTPQQRRQETLEALILQVVALSCQNPVLIILEDGTLDRPYEPRAVGSYRRQNTSPPRTADRHVPARIRAAVGIGRPYVTAITINRLGEGDIRAMINGVVGNKLLPANIRQDIIARADGIPLFVEEMTKAALEAESEGAAERAIGVVPSPALAVPASLHAPLMARLDRLGPAKEVAQVGAAIGREFSHALLAAAVQKPEAELGASLNRLISAGLLFRQGVPPHASYLFKHALVRDAAYGTLLREPRRALHARIAETLDSHFPDIAESQPELLARHCSAERASDRCPALPHRLTAFSICPASVLSPYEIRRHAEQTMSLASEHGFPFCVAWGLIYRGWSMSALGELEEGHGLVAKGLALHRATGSVAYQTFALILLAEACGKLGRTTEGLNYLTEAEQIIETTNERFHEAELHRVRGDLLNATGDQVAAEHGYHQALGVARRQSARTLELRAATSLARLWRAQGNRTEARDLLAPIYGWFTEGFDTPVLQEAKSLLDELT